jgi:hypothetical protein
MTLRKVCPLFDQPIKVGRLHKGIAQTCNRVIALLIRDYENDVRLLRSHH